MHRAFFMSVLMLAVVLAGFDTRAADKPKPAKPKKVAQPAKHDPPDIPFRRAPMSAAVRSVIIPLATNLHVAFDTELLRTHVVWQGQTLNLWGTPYHQAKDRFYCDFDGQALWTMPPVFPWEVGKIPDHPALSLPQGARFLGIDTSLRPASVFYEFPIPDGTRVQVREEFCAGDKDVLAVARVIEVGPASVDLWFLVHAVPLSSRLELSGEGIKRQTATLHFEEALWKEVKNESELTTTPRTADYKLGWMRVPAHDKLVRLKVRSLSLAQSRSLAGSVVAGVVKESPEDRTARTGTAATFPADKGFLLPGGDEFYRIERFPVPKEIELGVTGMDFLPNGDLAVCTWQGDVYVVEKPTGPPAAAKYRRFARGLCEPCGLKVIDGEVYIVQKQELTRLKDTDGNGEADLFECINQGWGFTGNYHDFTFGPTVDRDGNFHIYRIGAHGHYDVPYMGWDIIVSRDGRKITPFCSGLRSPDGFGTYQGDFFMTENQGNWMGACKLNHLQQGRFYGYPSTKPAPREQFDNPKEFSPPAVWFPYKLVRSASGFATIEDDRFGPFKGQLLVGEFQNALVARVFLEKVNGAWQGCVWPFAKGFNSGVNRVSMGPDGKLYVGGVKNAAWAAVAPKDYSLDRVTWTGKVPFEVKEVRARLDGFELTFTQPVDAASAGKADNFDVSQYGYEYHEKYGSPEYDFDGKADSASEVKVVHATVSPDKLRVTLQLSGWRAGYVAAIRLLDIQSAEGKPLRNETCYYTLNQIPK